VAPLSAATADSTGVVLFVVGTASLAVLRSGRLLSRQNTCAAAAIVLAERHNCIAGTLLAFACLTYRIVRWASHEHADPVSQCGQNRTVREASRSWMFCYSCDAGVGVRSETSRSAAVADSSYW
jgi:hypothetical protein